MSHDYDRAKDPRIDQQARRPAPGHDTLARTAGLLGNERFGGGGKAPLARFGASMHAPAPPSQVAQQAVGQARQGFQAAEHAVVGHGNADPGAFRGRCHTAVTNALQQWKSVASLQGVMIIGPLATGGRLVGPPLLGSLMTQLSSGPPEEAAAGARVAQAFATAFGGWTASAVVPGLPWYPAFAAIPSPIAPPTPNIPTPLATLGGVFSLPGAGGGDPLVDAGLSAAQQAFDVFRAGTLVTSVLGTGPVPTFAPPYVPVGPVIGGTGTQIAGGLI